jgi:hypothetical protein
MVHTLIFGMTQSGKTTLAKKVLIPKYKKLGLKTIVLDPLNDNWDADFQTDDENDFLRVLWNSRQCCAFLDEAGDTVGRYNSAMIQTATRGRHWGHKIHYLAQRASLIATTVRDQCSTLYLFTSSINDGKIHANEWNKPELVNCNTLQQGEFYVCNRFDLFEKRKLF